MAEFCCRSLNYVRSNTLFANWNFGSKLGSEIQVLGSVRVRYRDNQQNPSHLWPTSAKQDLTEQWPVVVLVDYFQD